MYFISFLFSIIYEKKIFVKFFLSVIKFLDKFIKLRHFYDKITIFYHIHLRILNKNGIIDKEKGEDMKGFVKWMDNAPLWLKIVFALPVLDIVWAVYRIVKGAAYGKLSLIIGGILWIILGWIILWIIDIVCICIWRDPKVLA